MSYCLMVTCIGLLPREAPGPGLVSMGGKLGLTQPPWLPQHRAVLGLCCTGSQGHEASGDLGPLSPLGTEPQDLKPSG